MAGTCAMISTLRCLIETKSSQCVAISGCQSQSNSLAWFGDSFVWSLWETNFMERKMCFLCFWQSFGKIKINKMYKGTNYHKNPQKRSQVFCFLLNENTKTVADQGFPVGGGANLPVGVNIRFCQIFQKTAWNWENFRSPKWKWKQKYECVGRESNPDRLLGRQPC